MAEFSLTSLVERQAHNSRVSTHLSCRTIGTQWLSFHSPPLSNDRHTMVEFSLTSLAEWQTHNGRVSTHPSCRTFSRHTLIEFFSKLPTPSALVALPFQSSKIPLAT
ncbi:unnamed protein product [Prunus armeniaca]